MCLMHGHSAEIFTLPGLDCTYLRNLLYYLKRVTRTDIGAALPTHYTLNASSENTQYGPGAVTQVVVYHLSIHTGMLSSH
jgi:hypothetical protein